MMESEIDVAMRGRIKDAQRWRTNLDGLFSRFARWQAADVAAANDDDLMRLWGKESELLGKTGLPPMARPTDSRRWQALRDMTAILIDASRPIGQRVLAAYQLGRANFTRGQLSFPSVTRAAMILACGRYGTVMTLSSGNELLGALGAPPMQTGDEASLTAGWNRFAELIEHWGRRLGTTSPGERAQIPWHYLVLARGDKNEDEPVAVEEVSRSDSEDVRQVFETVMPDPVQRKLCLELLADSIEQANAVHPASWALAVIRQGDALSLNVGIFIAIRIRGWATIVSILSDGIATENLERLKPFYDDSFADMAGSVVLDVPHGEFARLLQLFRDAHLRFVKEAAGRVRLRTPKYRNHSRDLLAQLSAAVGRSLPQPKYLTEAATMQAEQTTELPAAAREVFELLDRTRNVILYGPPGTGKTHAVRALREALLADQVSGKRGTMDRFCTFVTFHQSFSYEDFVEGIKPQTDAAGTVHYKVVDGTFKRVCRAASGDPARDYLFIIDEINRANISKVFGELITLLEDDKRIDPDDPAVGLTVTLPYSGETFGVPSNLYVLGTMNTADRSIALLDLALRRRFAFVEMPPRTELLRGNNVGGVELEALLASLNERVGFALDRDHRIGHSYLMEVRDVEALRFAWERKIVPLLMEYFYNDNERLRRVIGEAFFQAVKVPAGFDEREFERWEYLFIGDDAAFLGALKAIAEGMAGEKA